MTTTIPKAPETVQVLCPACAEDNMMAVPVDAPPVPGVVSHPPSPMSGGTAHRFLLLRTAGRAGDEWIGARIMDDAQRRDGTV